jgi:hypothetical protein
VAAGGPPRPDVTDDAIRRLFSSREAAEHQRTLGGPQWGLHELLGIRPPEDDPPSGDYYLDYVNFVISGPPMDALDLVLRICDRAPDDDVLCWVGTVFVEPLLNSHWKVISDRFENVARKRRSLRVAYSCTLTHLPRQARPWEERMRQLMSPDDQPRSPGAE